MSFHFTPDLFAALDARGISRHFVTLHVGAGTFLPVKADDTDDHRMHSEIGHVSEEVAQFSKYQHQTAIGQHVADDNPTNIRERHTEGVGDKGKGDIDRTVERSYQGAKPKD